MFFKPLLYQSIIPSQPDSTNWIIKSDKSERGGKSDLLLANHSNLLTANIQLHYLEGQEKPVGFITFRRKCRLFFKWGLSLNIQSDKDIYLAMVVQTTSGQLFVYDFMTGPEQKELYISWRDFYPSRRGKRIETKEKLKAKNIREVGILIQRSKQKKEILYQEQILREIQLRPTC